MAKPDILQMGSYPDWDQAPLEELYTVHRLFAAPDRAAFLAGCGPEIRAIVTRGDLGASAEVIAACPKLEIIAVNGVGYDAVALDAARARGIRVTNTPDVLSKDVADLALGMLIALARGMVPAEAWARSGDWATKGNFPLQRRVWGKRAGILGLGRIGREIARRLAALDMEIGYCNPAPKADVGDWRYFSDPVAMADWADVYVVALAASPATRHIVSDKAIAALGADGMLVNISRAANVDEEALLQALETGRLGGAALDVFEGEPRLNPRFQVLPNVLLQPHHASATGETRRAMGQLMRDNLAAHFAGKPLPTPVI